MTPELVPVRSSKRRGVDRGVVVAVVAVAFIGLLVLRPWGADKPPADSPLGDPSPRPRAVTLQTIRPTAAPTSQPEVLSLDDVSATLRTAPRQTDGALVVSFWRPDPVSVSYLDAAPLTTDLGSDCAGGALLGEGTDAIGVTLPRPFRPAQVMHVELIRLFDRQHAVPVPVASEVDASTGVAVVRADGVKWSVGHYALTMNTVGRSDTVALCVGHMTRLVDYSLVTFVPEIVDGATARKELLRELTAR